MNKEILFIYHGFVGDISKDKYKISITTTNGTDSQTIDIVLDEPLRKLGNKVDYIDFANQKVVRNVGVNADGSLYALENSEEEPVTLPEIPTYGGTTTITINTQIVPSKIKVKIKENEIKNGTSQLVLGNTKNSTLSNYKIYGNNIGNNIGNTLPQEYQEVEYIESTGTQYIDTGVIPNNNTRTEIKIFNNTTSSWYVFGARQTSSSTIIYAQSGATSGSTIGAVINGSSINPGWTRTSSGALYEISLETKNGTRDYSIKDLTNNKSYEATDVSYDIFSTDTNMYLLALNTTNILQGNTKLYYFKVYQEGVLIRNMIPCYLKTDDTKAGMYDLINGKFYISKGKGTFAKGNPIYNHAVGDISEDKYKISITTTNGTDSQTIDIVLDEPLRKLGDKVDYIDFANQKVVRNVGANADGSLYPLENSVEQAITLPAIPTYEGTTTITINTDVEPSNFTVEYY